MEGDKRPLPCIPFSQLAPITYENRPSLQSYIEEIHNSAELEKKELALAFPQISITGLAAKTDNQALLELPYPARQVLFSVNQLIWSFAGPIQQYRIQRSTTYVNEEAERFHRTTIRLESEQTFLDALLNVRNKDRIKALDVSSRSVFEQAQTNNRIGFLSDPQWKQTESDYVTFQTQVLRYQDDLRQSFSFLERALSIPLFIEARNEIPNLLMDNGLLQFNVAPLDRYLENALHLRNDLAGKAWEVDRAEKNASLLIHKYAPTITFSFNVSKFNFDTRFEGIIKQLTFQLAINASWEFDSFSKAHESSAQEAEMVALKMQQLDLSLAIQRDVKSAYYNLQSLLKEVEAEKARYITAQALFESLTHQYEIGQISEVDFTVAETNWKTAQYALDQQTIAAEKKYRELLFACGYPPEFESIQNLRSLK
jgi:outer membrane protein TolC